MEIIPVERVSDGIAIRLPESVVETLQTVPELLESVDRDEPAGRRLAASVYLDDPIADLEWWSLMEDEVTASRNADRSAFIEVMASAARGVVASVDEAEAILRVLAEARLVLAARIGLQREEDLDSLEGPAKDAMSMLAVLQELLIGVLDP